MVSPNENLELFLQIALLGAVDLNKTDLGLEKNLIMNNIMHLAYEIYSYKYKAYWKA